MTLALMTEAVRQLSRGIDYRVPMQDLSVALNRLPALPRDGFVINAIQPR